MGYPLTLYFRILLSWSNLPPPTDIYSPSQRQQSCEPRSIYSQEKWHLQTHCLFPPLTATFNIKKIIKEMPFRSFSKGPEPIIGSPVLFHLPKL